MGTRVKGLPDAARRTAYPGFIEYCDPTLSEHPPAGDGWAHEIKADGYRAQLHINGGNVTIYTRRGHDWTGRFRAIAEAGKKLKAKQLILDGEAVVLAATGVTDFHSLRRELGKRHSDRLIYQAFDVLYLDGYDLRQVSYVDRKSTLKRILENAPETLAYVEYLEGDGETVFRHACAMGIEGIVSKRMDAPLPERPSRRVAEAQMREERRFPDHRLCREAWGPAATDCIAISRSA